MIVEVISADWWGDNKSNPRFETRVGDILEVKDIATSTNQYEILNIDSYCIIGESRFRRISALELLAMEAE